MIKGTGLFLLAFLSKNASATGTIYAQAQTPGGATYDAESDTYTVSADGFDIWATQDEFRFLYVETSGDFSVSVCIKENPFQGGTNSWAKAGIMVRQNNTPGSPFVDQLATRGNGCAFQWRDTQDDWASWPGIAEPQAPLTYPFWVRMQRHEDAWYGDYCQDGQNWSHQAAAAHTLSMADPVLVGICLTSHEPGILTTTVFGNFAISPPVPGATIRAKPIGKGLTVTVDHDGFTGNRFFPWAFGTNHTIEAPSPQLGTDGIAYDFDGWSDGGPSSHEITFTQSTTYTAYFIGDNRNVYVYEDFTYPSSSAGDRLNGLTGGEGWTGPWEGDDVWISLAASPDMSAGGFRAEPFIAKIAAGGDDVRVQRSVEPAVASGEVWVQFHFMRAASPTEPGNRSGLTLFCSAGAEVSFVGTGPSYVVGIGNLPGADRNTTVSVLQPHRIVVRYVLDPREGQKDDVYLWVDPDAADTLSSYDAGGEDIDDHCCPV